MSETESQLCRLLGPTLKSMTLEKLTSDGAVPELTAQTDLLEDLAMESIQVMDFIADVEDHFDILIEVDQLGTIRTIKDLGVLVEEMMG